MLGEQKQEVARAKSRRAVWQTIMQVKEPLVALRIAQSNGNALAQLWIENGKSVVGAWSRLSGRNKTGYGALLDVLASQDGRYELIEAFGQPPGETINVHVADLAFDESAVVNSIKAAAVAMPANPQSFPAGFPATGSQTLPYREDLTSTHSNIKAFRQWQGPIQASDKQVADATASQGHQIAELTAELRKNDVPLKARFQPIPALLLANVLLFLATLGISALFDQACGKLCTAQINIAINRGARRGLGIPDMSNGIDTRAGALMGRRTSKK